MDTNDYMLWNSAISSFNNTLANNANVVLAANTSSEDRAFSERMSNLAWERNLEAWNMQNEYNLPANQYARQLEGIRMNGLNPNLVYGSSSSVTGAAGSPSPYKFDGYHATAVPQFRGIDSVDSLLNTRLLQTQIEAQEAQNRFINARANNEEARFPGTSAKSNEQAYRWNLITSKLLGNYDEAVQANIAKEYWTGIKTEHEANTAHYKRDIAYYEAAMAEWLNTTNVPGLDLTYRQYMEQYKALLPSGQYQQLCSSVLNMASQIMYRKKQGELLDLKQEYQKYVNQFAKYGRAIGNDTVSTILSGILWLLSDDAEEVRKALEKGGETQLGMPFTYPGP